MSDYALRMSEVELARYRGMAAAAQELEADLWTSAGVVPGAHVIDLGCGPGAVLLALAERVGPTGAVIGVDTDAASVGVAEGLIAAAGLTNAQARVGHGTSTGLPAASADVVVMRHVLAHNQRIEQALVSHAASLVRPGGCVYLVDIDASLRRSRNAPAEDRELWERYIALHAVRGNDLQVGLRLPLLLAEAGLDVVIDTAVVAIVDSAPGLRPPSWAAREAMVEAGLADADDVRRWGEAFDAADQATVRPRLFLPYFVAAGRRS